MGHQRIAELGYSKDPGRLEVVVPHGTKLSDLAKICDVLFSGDIASRLPRGCLGCHSGDHLTIRERFETVIQVDLEKRAII